MKTIIVALFLVFFMALCSSAAQITVRWTMPVNNADGTPLIDLGGAKIYYGLESNNYTMVKDAGNTNQYTISNLVDGVIYYINGTAYNTAGLESDFTTEISKKASLPIPTSKPAQLKRLKEPPES